jgi:hypothetical protein
LEKQTAEQQADKTGLDNPAFDNIELQRGQTTATNVGSPQQSSISAPEDVSIKLKIKTFLSEFFDPSSIVDPLKLLVQKHKNYGRVILYLCLLNGVFLNCTNPEYEYINKVTISKYQWDEDKIGYFQSYGAFLILVGTAIMTHIIPKCYRISDGMIGIVGAIGSFISKIGSVSIENEC